MSCNFVRKRKQVYSKDGGKNSEPKTTRKYYEECLINNEEHEALRDLAELAEHELMAVHLATIDELTKIPNRRGFTQLATKSLELCARNNMNAALIYIDLNKFKSINDHFGHSEGDKALIAFANLLGNTFRESDVVARLSGDEFAVFLSGISTEPIEKELLRLDQALETYNKDTANAYDILYSSGFVNINHEHKLSIEDVLQQADTLMYKNK